MRVIVFLLLLVPIGVNVALGADVVAINFDAASYLGNGQFSDVVPDGTDVNMGFWSATDVFGSWIAGSSSFDPFGMPSNDSAAIYNSSGTFYLLEPVFANASAYTVEMWFATGNVSNAALMRIRTNNGAEWRVDTDNSGFFTLTVGGVGTFTTAAKAKLYEWNHIALIRSDPDFKVYHNGALVGAYATGPTGNSGPSGLSINFLLSDNLSFRGYIDDVRVTDAALGTEQLGFFGDSLTIKDCNDYLAVHPPKAGDVTGDCHVDILDLLEIASNWLTCYDMNPLNCN